MLDLNTVRGDRERVASAIKNRGLDLDLGQIISIDEKRRLLLGQIEAKRAQRNVASQKVGELMRQLGQAKKTGQPVGDLEPTLKELKASSSGLGEEIARFEEELRPIEDELGDLMLLLPNIPHKSVPVGSDASENEFIRQWGEPTEFDFEPQAHWDIGESLRILDFASAAKISGARFTLYRGAGARLERALINFMLDTQTQINGYTEVLPPVLVNKSSMTGTGQLPKFAEDLFKCAQDELWLIPTAEVPITNIHREEIIPAEKLPIKYAACTTCFRREAGAHGRETRGLIRQHQFNKVELVKFVEPKNSYDELESLTNDAETILQKLKLPYRIISLCTGDLGFAAAKTYDLEVWMPSYHDYKEISSCSNFEDFQGRRADIRYRPDSGRPQFVHTLNGSGLAIGRTVAAILENYQRADGSIEIPEALRTYMAADEIRQGT